MSHSSSTHFSLISSKGVTVWLHGWRKNKWKTAQGADVKNKSLIEYISALLALRSQYGQTVKLEHVYGHVGIEGNEGADRQANMGTLLPRVPDPDWESRTKETLQTAKSLASGVIPEDGKSWLDKAILTEEVSKVWDPSNVEVRNKHQDPIRFTDKFYRSTKAICWMTKNSFRWV